MPSPKGILGLLSYQRYWIYPAVDGTDGTT
jgi:hypothetical protein